MKRVALLSSVLSLIISCAVPTGAVFALEEVEGEPSSILAPVLDETVELSPEPENLVEEDLLDPKKPDEPVVQPAQKELIHTSPSVVSPDPPIVVPPEEVLPISSLIITAYKASGAHLHAVQLYNNSANIVPLDDFSLLYIAGGNEYEIPLVSGWMEPRSYVVIAWQGESEHADIEFEFSQLSSGLLESIELHHVDYQPHIVTVSTAYNGELLHRFKSAAGNYTTNTTFASGEATISGGGLYVLPDVPELSIREVLVNPRDCTYGIESVDCYDYIKLRNDSSEELNLGLYRLRSGYSNANSTAANTVYFDVVLEPGAWVTLSYDRDGEQISFTANDGTVWLEDIYGYESYDLEVPPYVDSDLVAQIGRSWAYNDTNEQWQWATPSPNSENNNFTVPEPEGGSGALTPSRDLVPCGENQYRSEETNRCRNTTTSGNLALCREGQYRNEETNRCRSIATAASSVLKPCADDQFRHPTTNRCRKIASAEDIALADCGEGRERNPDTNRCRNVLGVSSLGNTLPFPVEETVDGAERFAGWWTLGIITALGIGYGVWEWREELLKAGRRAGQFARRPK